MARMAPATVPPVRRMHVPADVAMICLVIALASTVAGIGTPMFPLHARALHLDLAAIGWLPASSGFASLCLALPLGLLSDRVGRRRVIAGGILTFALGMACVGAANGPAPLLVGCLLFGAAGVSIFPIGAALLGDITATGRRPLAFGLYTTAMGAGFTLGPLLGGQVAGRAGTGAAFLVGALVGAAGGTLALLALPGSPGGAATARANRSLRAIVALARRADLGLACLGTLLMSWAFNGAISTIFPLHGAALGLPAATIGALFALRALISAFGRLPNGMLARALGNRAIMLGALILDALALLALAFARQTWLLALLLLADGLAYGAYLVSGQAFVADRTTAGNRGAAVGLYAMAGSVGAIAAPPSLGAIAARWGLAAPFGATGALLALGVAVIGAGMYRSRGEATP